MVFQNLKIPVVLFLCAVLLNVYLPDALPDSVMEYASQFSLTFLWFSSALLLNSLLGLMLWDGIVKHSLGRTPPRLAVQMANTLVYVITLACVVKFVFHQPVTTLLAASGALGLVVGFALRNLIMDTFSGFAIHLERPFTVGDWVNVHTRMGEFIGRVEETNWRTTLFWTTERNVVIVPNSYLTATLLTNFSRPKTAARFELDFVIDFSVPTERALRVLTAAITQSIGNKGPLADPAPKVRVNTVTENGVQYRIRYFLEPADVSPSKARNTITCAVVDHLNQAGISLSYPRQDVFIANMPWRHKDWTFPKDRIHQLKALALFSRLEDQDLDLIAASMSAHTFKKGAQVVMQGDEGESMFILTEGLMEVFVDQPDGNPLKVADMVPGSFFGEKSLLTGEKRSATIVCSTESKVCEITKSTISNLILRNPDIEEMLSRAVVERELENELAANHATKEEIEEKVESSVGVFMAKMKGFFKPVIEPDTCSSVEPLKKFS